MTDSPDASIRTSRLGDHSAAAAARDLVPTRDNAAHHVHRKKPNPLPSTSARLADAFTSLHRINASNQILNGEMAGWSMAHAWPDGRDIQRPVENFMRRFVSDVPMMKPDRLRSVAEVATREQASVSRRAVAAIVITSCQMSRHTVVAHTKEVETCPRS